MLKKFHGIVFLILMFNCKHQKEEKQIIAKIEVSDTHIKVDINNKAIDSSKLHINFKKAGDYNVLKNSIKSDRVYFKQWFESNPEKAIDSASHYIYSKLINDIVPHWYGTTWDFNGHTNIPNQGDIACGYFVSTTLKHIGV
ncbi:hypothetical protein [uncultured Algibacter sp.]|uniref:hypothetical protein n=1 Tax=uncultured Algibacter sp. TaxID=298659 RepID=UPI00321755C2